MRNLLRVDCGCTEGNPRGPKGTQGGGAAGADLSLMLFGSFAIAEAALDVAASHFKVLAEETLQYRQGFTPECHTYQIRLKEAASAVLADHHPLTVRVVHIFLFVDMGVVGTTMSLN